MSNNFYKAFEDKYRGSRELIKSRLQVYLKFVTPLKNIYPDAAAVDLGCGRGEWLEVLTTHGFSPQGIDLDENMLLICRDLHLHVQTCDAVSFIKQLPDESQTIVSAFHLVEHIPFDTLQQIIIEALRVLKPAGILILETPNPENIKVGTEHFYLDPTHMKPIPSNLLSFLPEFYSFYRTKIVRLQEKQYLANQKDISLSDVIEGVSPDYAVVAQKKAHSEILNHFDNAFAQEIGLTLSTLSAKFEDRIQEIAAKAERAEAKAERAEAKAERAEAKLITQDKSTQKKQQLLLDTYVLGQNIRTGIYRVCDEIYPRLAQTNKLNVSYIVREDLKEASETYLNKRIGEFDLKTYNNYNPSDFTGVLLSPFGVAPEKWLNDKNILHAHIIYDLIALRRPNYFTPEAASEVCNIIGSLRENTLVFSISEHTKKDLMFFRPDLDPGNIKVIPLAAGENFVQSKDKERMIEVRQKYNIPINVPYILSLATLEIRKNLDQVVRSFVMYVSKNPECNTHLVLSGMSGWKLNKLNDELAMAGEYRDKIILTGYIEEDDLSTLYSDALCFMYLSRYEGFGLPPLEAMSCGTPVICSNNTSLPEVVGDTALTVDAADTTLIADALQKLISSEQLRNKLSFLGLERSSKFNWDKCAEIISESILAHCKNIKTNEAKNEAGKSNITYPYWIEKYDLESSPQQGGLRLQGIYRPDTNDSPLVSYVTVVKNNVKDIGRTIDSVQAQTHKNIEHIIVDGASTDGTLNIIKEYADKIDYFISEPDTGLYNALNKAIQFARGRIICVLNSDDWLQPDAAETAVAQISNFDNAYVLCSAANVIDKNIQHYWEPTAVHHGSYFTCANVCHNGIYATKKAYETSGLYDDSYEIAADFEWIMRAFVAKSIFIYTKKVTVNYSLGGVSSNFLTHSMECIRVCHKRFPLLSRLEINGLYHSFFVFSNALYHYDVDVPQNRNEFINEIINKYADYTDLVSAISCATKQTFGNSTFSRTSIAASLKWYVVKHLSGYPKIYSAVRKIYRHVRYHTT